MRQRSLVSILIFITTICAAQIAAQQSSVRVKDLVAEVTGSKGSNEERTRKLVRWINTNFTWSYTDYQKRSIEEIIERRAGNCAELSNVLAALLKEGNIPFRWAAEINIEPERASRQESAAKLVGERGNRFSVFGLRHNDHVWLEVQDERNRTWFPADPAIGVVGLNEWLRARVAFDARTRPVVPAVAEIVKDMIVPFVVVIRESRGGKPVDDRSRHYLTDGFNALYNGRLAKLPAWKGWTRAVEDISPYGRAAFAGEANLHERERQIEEVWQAYEKLRQEAINRKIRR